MKKSIFKISVLSIALLFVIIFIILIIPPFIQNPDIFESFSMGFVNPFSSGYSIDVIFCWLLLLAWVIYEYKKVKYGWVCIILGVIPGVAVGLGLYMFLRIGQLEKKSKSR